MRRTFLPVNGRRIAAAAFMAFAGSAEAQITYDGCRDAAGRPVRSQLTPQLPDVAAANVDWQGPVIYYNPQVLSALAPQTRLFFYSHECGHHNLAHTFVGSHPLTREQAADCWGIVEIWRAGMVGPNDLPMIQNDLFRSPGDWTHLPGPYRSINLAACLRKEGIDPTVPYRTVTGPARIPQPCTHALHPGGDATQCQHPAHPMGDVYQCTHVCPGPYGYVPCHPAGDLYPCSHPAHAFDSVPCNHPAHPAGH